MHNKDSWGEKEREKEDKEVNACYHLLGWAKGRGLIRLVRAEPGVEDSA